MKDDSFLDAVRALDAKILADSENTPERFARMTEAQHEGGLLHGDRPICPFLRPHVMRRSEYDAISSAATTIAGALERLVGHALADDALLDELGVAPRETAMARVDPGYSRACVTSRLDTYLTDGGFAFLEYNGESPAGIGDQRVLERMLFELPLVDEFRRSHRVATLEPHRRLLESLVDTYWEWGGEADRPSIAIVDWTGVPTSAEFRILGDFFESEGYPSTILDPGDLEYDGAALSANGRPLDVLYKRVIIHELLERCGDDHPILRAYADGRICMVNGFRSKIAHKKASLAILSDPRYEALFADEQLDAVRAHVPWTRRVRDGAVTFEGESVPFRDLLRLERERLVLKPNDDYGGHGVALGRDVAPERWAELIETALAEPFVAQELVEVRSVSIPRFGEDGRVVASEMTVDFDPFLFDGRPEGALVRLSSTSLSNVSAGGGETALLVVEE